MTVEVTESSFESRAGRWRRGVRIGGFIRLVPWSLARCGASQSVMS